LHAAFQRPKQVHLNDRAGSLLLLVLQPFVDELLALAAGDEADDGAR
jgi:hypothetical protein